MFFLFFVSCHFFIALFIRFFSMLNHKCVIYYDISVICAQNPDICATNLDIILKDSRSSPSIYPVLMQAKTYVICYDISIICAWSRDICTPAAQILLPNASPTPAMYTVLIAADIVWSVMTSLSFVHRIKISGFQLTIFSSTISAYPHWYMLC